MSVVTFPHREKNGMANTLLRAAMPIYSGCLTAAGVFTELEI